MDKKPTLTIRDLYPHFTTEQLAEVEDTHDQYLALVLRIFERLESEMAPQADPLSPGVAAVSCKSKESQLLP